MRQPAKVESTTRSNTAESVTDGHWTDESCETRRWEAARDELAKLEAARRPPEAQAGGRPFEPGIAYAANNPGSCFIAFLPM